MVKYRYMDILHVIKELSGYKIILTLSKIAKCLNVSQSSLRHHIRKLTDLEYITFYAHMYDQRAKIIQISLMGSEELKKYVRIMTIKKYNRIESLIKDFMEDEET